MFFAASLYLPWVFLGLGMESALECGRSEGERAEGDRAEGDRMEGDRDPGRVNGLITRVA